MLSRILRLYKRYEITIEFHKKTEHFFSIFVYTIFLLCSTCWATEVDFETIEVKGRKRNLVGLSSSASTGSVSQGEIAIRPLSRTGEVLELVPGMVVTQHSGNGKANQYFLRGFNLDHGTDFATYLDGMPLNLPTHGHGQGYTDLNFIIPEAIISLDYKKGAYYTEASDFSGAGSAWLASINKTLNSNMGLTVGEFGFVRSLLVHTIGTQKGSTLIALESNQYDGPWENVKEDVGKTNFWIKHTTNVSVGELSASLMAYDNNWNSADQIPSRAVEQGEVNRLGSIDSTVGGKSNRLSVNVEWQSDKVIANAYMIRYSMNLWSNFTYFLGNEDLGDQFEQTDDRMVYGGNIVFAKPHNWQGFGGHNTFGAQIRLDNIKEVGLFQTQSRIRFGTIRRDDVNQSSTGIYWENETGWTKQIRTTLGARYDVYNFDVSDLAGVNSSSINLSPNSGTKSDELVSLKGNLIYQVNTEFEGYLSIGQGFHSNDARGTTIQIDPVDGAPINSVDPLVRSFGYEAGLRGFIADKLSTSVSLWLLELDSELLFVGDAGNTEASGKSMRKGLEFTSYYHIAGDWTLDFEYAYTDAKLVDAPKGKNNIPGAIKHVLQTGISVDQGKGWFGSLRYRYFGKRALVEDTSVESNSSGIWNLRVGYRFGNKLSFSLDVLNLSDSKDHDVDYFYESRLENEPANQSIDDIHFHPFEPRSVRASVSYFF